MRKEFKHKIPFLGKIIVISSLVLPLLLVIVIDNVGVRLLGSILFVWQLTYFITIYASKIIIDIEGNLIYFRPMILWVKGVKYQVDLNNVKSAEFIVRESKVPVKYQGRAFLMPIDTPSINFKLKNGEVFIFRLHNFESKEAQLILLEILNRFPNIEIIDNLDDYVKEDLI